MRGRIRALAALLAAAILACSLSACAGGSSGAQALLRETFRSHTPIESGRIDLALALTSGARGAGGAAAVPAGASLLSLQLSGPFQGLGAGRLPEFALQVVLGAGARSLHAGATSVSNQLYIELEGTQFAAPAGTVTQLQKSYAQSVRSASSAAAGSTFAALGIDPGEWLVNPRIVAANAQSTHITGELDAARFLADAQRLSGATGALGLGGGAAALGSSGAIAQLAQSVRAARVDVYTGTSDHELRRLLLSVSLAATPQARSALGLSSGATLTLDLRFSALNRPQRIAAPAHAQPISALVPALQRLGLALGAGAAGASS